MFYLTNFELIPVFSSAEGEASGAFTKDQNAAINKRALTGETTHRIDNRSKQSITTHLSQRCRNNHAINGTNDTALATPVTGIALTRQSHRSSSISPSISIDNQHSSTKAAKINGPSDNNAHLLPNPPDPPFDHRTDDQHVVSTKDGKFLVEDATSIQVDQSPPRVNSQWHSLDMRTRLLARLELEKSQASGPSDAEGHSNSIKSPAAQRASVNSETAQNDGGSSVDISTKDGAAHDRVSGLPSVSVASPSDSLSIMSHKRGQSDPDSVPVSVAEEARAREAKLKARAQLRVRLAAEKRRVDVG